jgi:hypothetical protein
MEASYQTAALTASGLSWAAVAGTHPLTAKTGVRVPQGAPVPNKTAKLRTPMLLRFRCNFVRLKDDLQLLNVPQTCASHGPSYRTHPRLYLRCRAGAWRMSGLLRVQPLGEVN